MSISSPKIIPVALSIFLIGLTACDPADEDPEIAETIANLLEAGYPAESIDVDDDQVYADNDAIVSLQASREMLEVDSSAGTHEQYRTTNLVGSHINTICVQTEVRVSSTVPSALLDPAINKLSTGLDWAIANYNNLGIRLKFRRIDSSTAGCDFIMRASVVNDRIAIANFPSSGNPGSGFSIGWRWGQSSPDLIEHAITHEIGHTLGLRHTDYFNRSISCGTGGNEGPGYFGVHHIPGTPTGASSGSSLMNACAPDYTNGEFTSTDRTALHYLY